MSWKDVSVGPVGNLKAIIQSGPFSLQVEIL